MSSRLGCFKSTSSMALLKVWVPADLLAKTVLLFPPQITCEAPQTSLRAGVHCYSGFVKAIIVKTQSESRWWDVASGNLVLFAHSSVPIHWAVLNYNSVHTCFISILDLAKHTFSMTTQFSSPTLTVSSIYIHPFQLSIIGFSQTNRNPDMATF